MDDTAIAPTDEEVDTIAAPRGKGWKADRLTESAVEVFSQHGYEGTSLRDIATRAGVRLSMIDRCFGSKLDLFNEVQRVIWKDINRDREELMRTPIATGDDGSPTLAAVLHAIIFPVVARAVGDGVRAPMIKLIRENTSMRVHHGMGRGPKQAVNAERWVGAVRAACPELGQGEAVWAISFVIGTMYCGQLLDGWLDDLMPAASPRTALEITEVMATFCAAGIARLSADRTAPKSGNDMLLQESDQRQLDAQVRGRR